MNAASTSCARFGMPARAGERSSRGCLCRWLSEVTWVLFLLSWRACGCAVRIRAFPRALLSTAFAALSMHPSEHKGLQRGNALHSDHTMSAKRVHAHDLQVSCITGAKHRAERAARGHETRDSAKSKVRALNTIHHRGKNLDCDGG
jgi:hypothetical protein